MWLSWIPIREMVGALLNWWLWVEKWYRGPPVNTRRGGGGPHSPIEMSLLLFVQDDKNPAGQHLFPFGPHSIGNRSSSSSPLQRLREAGKGIKETKCRKRELQRKLPSLRCSLKNDHYRRTKSCSLWFQLERLQWVLPCWGSDFSSSSSSGWGRAGLRWTRLNKLLQHSHC